MIHHLFSHQYSMLKVNHRFDPVWCRNSKTSFLSVPGNRNSCRKAKWGRSETHPVKIPLDREFLFFWKTLKWKILFPEGLLQTFTGKWNCSSKVHIPNNRCKRPVISTVLIKRHTSNHQRMKQIFWSWHYKFLFRSSKLPQFISTKKDITSTPGLSI